jgi:lysophospholipid acyltransferase
MSFTFRTFLYGVWTLTECVCLVAGFGFMPATAQADQSWDGVKNIDPSGLEMAQNMKVVLRLWNITTQKWLWNYVYMRFPKALHGNLRMLLTFLICGAWVSSFSIAVTEIFGLTCWTLIAWLETTDAP